MDTSKYRIFIKGINCTNDIDCINSCGNKVHVKYKSGQSYVYNAFNVKIEESVLNDDKSKNCFDYLLQIADVVGLRDEKDRNILSNNYKKIDFLAKETVLANFLSGQMPKSYENGHCAHIYPFGFNLSQRTAVDRALCNKISVIDGPPGTGKTQTILNIIANIIMSGRTVAVVSANNSATANVLEKLQKYDFDFIAAFLGNSNNRAAFNAAHHDLPKMFDWKKTNSWERTIRRNINNLRNKLLEILLMQKELAVKRQEYTAMDLEYQHFNQKYSALSTYGIKHLNPDQTLRLWMSCEKYALRGRGPNIIDRLVNYFRYKISDKAFYTHSGENMIAICQKHWYENRLADLSFNITNMDNRLSEFDFSECMKNYSETSMALFKHLLAHRYKNSNRKTSLLSTDFLKEYPVVLSTTYSITNSMFSQLYDYVIIDEASQVDICTGALALGCAKNAVIVGDMKQLPNVVDDNCAKQTDEIFSNFNLPQCYRYKAHSLLATILELFPDVPRTMLHEHYRCHPKIIEFCNQRFYGGELITLTRPDSEREPLVVYKTAPGNHARNRVNRRQIDVIIDEVIPQQKLDVNNMSIGIVTPYRNQVAELQHVFKDTMVQADTVDKFQGREKDIIILSMVDNDVSDFADNPNRLNVAISRAVKQLIVVTNGNNETKDSNIKSLIDYIDYNNLSVVTSNVSSIFDCLYKCYADKRKQIVKSNVSEFDSENIMYDLIQDVLHMDLFKIFDVALHVPLKHMFCNLQNLTDTEFNYANNIMTHCDFVIFDRVSKKPKLRIEVDGTAYHRTGTKQYERDRMKDNIFRTYNIPLIRFNTDGSHEKQRLIQILKSLV